LTKVQSNEAEEKDLIQMNQETDEMLEKYQHQRNFRLWDIIAAVGLFLIIGFLVGRFHMSSAIRLEVVTVLYVFVVVYYYNFKAILPLTIYEAMLYTLKKLTQLYHSSLIRIQVIFVFQMLFFLVLRSNGNQLIEKTVASTMLVVDAMFIGPIFEEIVMRGFLYGYLKRYNRWLAWIIVTIAFYAMHTKDANYWHIILSGLCLYVYDCEGTLLAPIMIHILNNVIDIGLYIGFKNLM
jgi:membrane protease YdiL (CAAX protease family)